MNRILEFSPTQEEAVASRILVLVHQAMDQYLPSAGQANRQFTKTLYSEDSERTAASMAAIGDDHGGAGSTSSAFGSYEVTSPGGQPNSPPNPTLENQPPSAPPAPLSNHKAGNAEKSAARPLTQKPAPSLQPSQTESSLDEHDEGPDWVTRITLALLLAGLMLLAYVLFA